MKRESKFEIGDLVVFRQDRQTVYEVTAPSWQENRGNGVKIKIAEVGNIEHREEPYVHLVQLAEPIMQFFRFSHLPEPLQNVSLPFGAVAQALIRTLPRNPERTVALRKLLEAKDAAVRAAIYEG